jgi:post-segregation antitoxin (ccd killing protein)
MKASATTQIRGKFKSTFNRADAAPQWLREWRETVASRAEFASRGGQSVPSRA